MGHPAQGRQERQRGRAEAEEAKVEGWRHLGQSRPARHSSLVSLAEDSGRPRATVRLAGCKLTDQLAKVRH